MSDNQGPFGFTPNEIMTIAASRARKNDDVCFVGIGAPSAACNVARLTHAPGITLIYESGTIGTAPEVLPLSIGDGELCETAVTTVAVPEMFRYWLQGGRISIGFLGAAQLDKFGNINTTVIGDYFHPKTRLPGGGGAPEIATSSREIYITMAQTRRGMVEKIDFFTSFGHGEGGDHRKRLGIDTAGPTLLITDLAIWKPDPVSKPALSSAPKKVAPGKVRVEKPAAKVAGPKVAATAPNPAVTVPKPVPAVSATGAPKPAAHQPALTGAGPPTPFDPTPQPVPTRPLA